MVKAPGANRNRRLPLTAVVTKILAGLREPLSVQELADQVLASGYRTNSKNFKEVIWGGLSKMPNVENVPGKGYRLKTNKVPTTAGKAKDSK